MQSQRLQAQPPSELALRWAASAALESKPDVGQTSALNPSASIWASPSAAASTTVAADAPAAAESPPIAGADAAAVQEFLAGVRLAHLHGPFVELGIECLTDLALIERADVTSLKPIQWRRFKRAVDALLETQSGAPSLPEQGVVASGATVGAGVYVGADLLEKEERVGKKAAAKADAAKEREQRKAPESDGTPLRSVATATIQTDQRHASLDVPCSSPPKAPSLLEQGVGAVASKEGASGVAVPLEKEREGEKAAAKAGAANSGLTPAGAPLGAQEDEDAAPQPTQLSSPAALSSEGASGGSSGNTSPPSPSRHGVDSGAGLEPGREGKDSALSASRMTQQLSPADPSPKEGTSGGSSGITLPPPPSRSGGDRTKLDACACYDDWASSGG